MEFKRLEKEEDLEIEALCEENRKKIAETKLNDVELMVHVSQASQNLVKEGSKTNLDDDASGHRVD